jgi:hypothetical protein
MSIDHVLVAGFCVTLLNISTYSGIKRPGVAMDAKGKYFCFSLGKLGREVVISDSNDGNAKAGRGLDERIIGT